MIGEALIIFVGLLVMGILIGLGLTEVAKEIRDASWRIKR